MLVNTAAFGSKISGTKVCIANRPPTREMPNLETLAVEMQNPAILNLLPLETEVWLVKNEEITWEEFAKRYRRRLNVVNVPKLLRRIAWHLGVDELTLCCYESEKDEHCHRKILFEYIPDEMKGNRR